MELGAALGRVEIAFDGSGVAAARKALADLEGQGKSLAGTMSSAGLVLAGVGAGLALPFAAAVNEAANFEQELANIAAVGGADAVARMDELEQAALAMGASTVFSAQEAAQGIEELVKAGLPVQDVLDGAAESALNLASATGTSVPQAAAIMSTALNVFGDSLTQFNTAGEKAVYISDTLAQAANASATDVLTLGQGLSQVGSVAAQFGIGIDQTTEALALMANAGIQGSDAGTSLKTMLLALLDPTEKQAAAMAQLGLSYDQFYQNGQFIGLAKAAELLKGSLSGLTQEQQQTALAVLFGSDAIRAATVLTDEGAAGFEAMAKGMDSAGTTAEQAAVRIDTFAGQMETLRGSISTLATVMGQALIPLIRPVVDGLTSVVNWFAAADETTQQFIAVLTSGIGILAAFAGGTLLVASKVAEGVKAMKELSTVTEALTGGRFGIGALTGLMGPWGLAIGGVIGALGLLTKMQRDSAQAAEEQIKAYQKALDAASKLPDIIARVNLRELLANFNEETFTNGTDNITALDHAYEKLLETKQMDINQMADYTLTAKQVEQIEGDMTTAVLKSGDAAGDTVKALQKLYDMHATGALKGDDYAAAMDDVAAALAYDGDGAEYVRDRVYRLIQQFGQDGNLGKFKDSLHEVATNAGEVADRAILATGSTGDLTDGLGDQARAAIVTGAALGGYIDALNEAAKASKEARDAARQESDAIAAAAKDGYQKAETAQRKATDRRIAEIERGSKAEVKQAQNTGDELVKREKEIGDNRIAIAKEIESEKTAAAEQTANAEIRQAQQAGRETVQAAEGQARDVIRARRLEETQTVNAAEKVADAQIQAAKDAEEAVVDAAQRQADGQIAAAEDAEKATVAAAERAANAQTRALDEAARAATRSIELQLRAVERAADVAYNRAASAADRAEQAANDAAQREYDARVKAADDAYSKAEDRARRSGDGISKREQKRLDALQKEQERIQDEAERKRQAAEDAAAKAKEQAIREAERKANAIKREAEREAAKKEREIQRENERKKREITRETEAAAQEAARQTEAVRTAAEANVAAAKEAAAQTSADAIAAIERGLELTRRREAKKTTNVEREQNAILNTAKQDAENTTAAAIDKINADLEDKKQRYAHQTEVVKNQAAKNVRDIERDTADKIREINRKLIEDRRTQEQNFTDFMRKQAEQRRRIIEGARKNAQQGIDPGSAIATRRSARDARRENLDGPVPAGSGIAGWMASRGATGPGAQPAGQGRDSVLRAVMAQQGEFLRSLMAANAAAISAAMPKTLEATVVIDGAGFKQVVLGTALAPLGAAAERVGRRREAWG